MIAGMDRPKLLLPAVLAVTFLGAGCGSKSPSQPTPPPPPASDAVVAMPDAAPPDAAPAANLPPHDYPVG
jgi:hypothetical protein